ncbi:P-loop containing nucleoside triphosphate hydrolase protein [Viridothelium virens]|uniref:P-loop containing nucleoside triphosphate hydrolase protein n=1 Tax=Viridothelium virens TaxID=1048519 RepID=A0A6A6HE86_VIRVR|nr:P-loop containing nucleoside triphosphate hydrolase protein [Viridothelium virens]
MLTAATAPKTAPASFIAFYVAEVAILLPGLADAGTSLQPVQIVEYVVLFAAVAATLNVLLMPLRDPSLPLEDISPVFTAPKDSLRSPEDNLTLWQFITVSWMAPMISVGSNRQMHDDDVWFLAYVFQHRRLHESFRQLRGSVTRRLLSANGIDIAITTGLGVLESLATYSTPILLQQLLWSMENPDVPRSSAVTYALLSLLLRFVAAQSGVISLWYSRRCYERSRGEMITMLYEKTLSRKIIGDHDKNKSEESNETKANGTKSDSNPSGRTCGFCRIPFWPRAADSKEKVKKPASMGKILNLMRGDVYEVAQRFWEVSTIVTAPLGLILSLVLTWKLIGWPCLIGILTVAVAQSANALITRLLISYERFRRSTTDDRLQVTTQLVEAIRHLRWYGWQNEWLEQIISARQRELKWRVITALWTALIHFFNYFSSGMFPVAALYAYTVLAGRPLSIDLIFPALQLFGLLEGSLRVIPGLITTLINAYIAMGRIEDFMKEPNKPDAELNTTLVETSKLRLENASFAWPGTTDPVLKNLSISFPSGLSVVCGKVGAGKTALLQSLLGELDMVDGFYERSGEMIGYCSQTPWLQSMSIRENILFSSPYEEQRYKRVLEACALIPDLANFKHGDLSNIGENGIGLSGGQKARVALARAMYSQCKILFLDDPISALDHQTAETVVRRCLTGPLSEDRTIILVTHRTELCNSIAEQIIEITEGDARVLPSSLPASILKTSDPENASEDDQEESNEEEKDAAVPDKFIEDEHRAHGGVQLRIYWEYVKAGKLKWWVILVWLLTTGRLLSLLKQWFLKAWGEAYDNSVEKASSGLFDRLPLPDVNVRPWLLVFFTLAVVQAVTAFIGQTFMLVIIYSAGKRMFQEAMIKVSHATFRFYDVTPVGRLMNRLTSDIATVDGNISFQFQIIAFSAVNWISSVVVIASVTPIFLVFSVVLTVAFVLIFRRFLPTSQSLRRLEMVSLSPLMSNFGALVEGLVTVRAFCAQHRFQDRVIEVVDNFQKMDHFYWTLQAWLMYRFDTLSALSSFILTVLALYTNVSPGLTAFVLVAADNFVQSTHQLCKQYGQLQMQFVSVERVIELLQLDQEPEGDIKPPAWWPSLRSEVSFHDVTIRYAPNLDASLTNVSLKIPGGSTTAIIGRTGSGKSTLALSLLATVRPEKGQILLDNVDIARVDTQALRRRITFLAQDPVLFPGAMRKNLDPLNEHSDEDCAAVLERVCSRHGWKLETEIEAGGKNLSQGQRQLIGLTRAVLRRSSVVILDEATASVDLETSMEIQQILREEMKESTVITIAHRLEAVKNADYCIVLDKGGVLAQGPAADMLHTGTAVDNVQSTEEI